MKNKTLIERVKKHEENCKGNPRTIFTVIEVKELADGVLGVRDDEQEYTVYFDKTKYTADDADVSGNIRHFPAQTGFFSAGMVGGWDTFQMIAKQMLERRGREKIVWHKKPIDLAY